MNCQRHELRCGALGLQFNSWSEARNHEANYAASKADFINKFQIALKECYETDYWLGLFKDTHMITENEYNDMFFKCNKIRNKLK